MQPNNQAEPEPTPPLKPADFQILLVLAEADRHGYGIMKEVERLSGGSVRLGLGSLYRLLNRLLEMGWIEPLENPPGAGAEKSGLAPDDRSGGPPRRYYRITPSGRQAAEAETERLAQVLEAARARLKHRAGDA